MGMSSAGTAMSVPFASFRRRHRTPANCRYSPVAIEARCDNRPAQPDNDGPWPGQRAKARHVAGHHDNNDDTAEGCDHVRGIVKTVRPEPCEYEKAKQPTIGIPHNLQSEPEDRGRPASTPALIM